MTRLVILSGGQTGADQGALLAARAAGLPTAGWAPAGWLTEDGPAPWLAEYGLKECHAPGYPARTARNVLEATALLWFGNPYSPGGRLTFGLASQRSVDSFTVIHDSTPREVADWLMGFVYPGEDEVRLLVAGNRESGSPGLGAKVEAFLGELFALLRAEGVP